MSANNNCTFLGNLVRDPELKTIPSGKAVCEFTIAVNGYKDDVAFIPCTAWEKRGEAIAEHFTKGKQILVQGDLRQENWEDKETGAKRSKLTLNVFDWAFSGPKEDGVTGNPSDAPTPKSPSSDVPF